MPRNWQYPSHPLLIHLPLQVFSLGKGRIWKLLIPEEPGSFQAFLPDLSHHTPFLKCLLAAQLIDKNGWGGGEKSSSKRGPSSSWVQGLCDQHSLTSSIPGEATGVGMQGREAALYAQPTLHLRRLYHGNTGSPVWWQ